jgi:hypothetical protein
MSRIMALPRPGAALPPGTGFTPSPVPAPDNQRHVTLPAGTREGSRGWIPHGACHGADTELFFPIATAGRALIGCGAGSGGQLSAGSVRRVRSATENRTKTTLTPTMIQAMRWTPLSVTLVWKTTPVMADEAMEPT